MRHFSGKSGVNTPVNNDQPILRERYEGVGMLSIGGLFSH
jgi:hypothetical protein